MSYFDLTGITTNMVIDARLTDGLNDEDAAHLARYFNINAPEEERRFFACRAWTPHRVFTVACERILPVGLVCKAINNVLGRKQLVTKLCNAVRQEMVRCNCPSDSSGTGADLFKNFDKIDRLARTVFHSGKVASFLGTLGCSEAMIAESEKSKEHFKDRFHDLLLRRVSAFAIWAALAVVCQRHQISLLGLAEPPSWFHVAGRLSWIDNSDADDYDDDDDDGDCSSSAANAFASLGAPQAKTLAEIVTQKDVFYQYLTATLTVYKDSWIEWLHANNLTTGEIDLFVADLTKKRNLQPAHPAADEMFAMLAKVQPFANWSEIEFLDSFSKLKEPHVVEAVCAWRDSINAAPDGQKEKETATRAALRDLFVEKGVFSKQETASLYRTADAVVVSLGLKSLADLGCVESMSELEFLDWLPKPKRARIVSVAKTFRQEEK